jgi:para-nitrobenzyl esterase
MSQADHPVVMTESGPVMGKTKSGVQLFCGIPYATPPINERRFMAAKPPEPWSDILDATRFGLAAPQTASGGMTDRIDVPWSEDCLTLNVCTPAADDQARPVLVWIHGGGYRTGRSSIPWYNGTSFALRGDVVTVSVNYRLGAFGFAELAHLDASLSTSGVNGLLDQITALEWVRDNIRAFGGDPNRVTIAGESAGSFSVSTLLGSERAQGLFHRAIAQSGAAHHTMPKNTASTLTDQLLIAAGADTVDALKARGAADLLKDQQAVDRWLAKQPMTLGMSAFYPSEGNEVIPTTLLGAHASGVGAQVPLMIGTNKDEASLFIMNTLDQAGLNRQIQGFGATGDLQAAYADMFPTFDLTRLGIEMSTDYMFKIPTLRLLELRAQHATENYVYQFDWESRQGHLRATHALEIPFAFNTLDAPGVKEFIGPGQLPTELAFEMHDRWIAFIHGHAPWEAYRPEAPNRMHFAEASSVREADESARLKAWEGVR